MSILARPKQFFKPYTKLFPKKEKVLSGSTKILKRNFGIEAKGQKILIFLLIFLFILLGLGIVRLVIFNLQKPPLTIETPITTPTTTPAGD